MMKGDDQQAEATPNADNCDYSDSGCPLRRVVAGKHQGNAHRRSADQETDQTQNYGEIAS